MNYQQQTYWIPHHQSAYSQRVPMTHAHVIPLSPPPTHRNKQQQQPRPVSMGSVMIPQQNYCYSNNVIIQQHTQHHHNQQQQPVYQYYYRIPLRPQPQPQPQPTSSHHHHVPPSPVRPTSTVDDLRRRSMDEISRKRVTNRMMSHRKISLDILPMHQRIPPVEYVVPGLHHRSSADGLPRTASSMSHCRLPPSSTTASHQQHSGPYYNKNQYRCQLNNTTLTRSASTMTGKSISSSYNRDRPLSAIPHRRPEGLRACISEGPARRVTPFNMASIAEERRGSSSLSLEDEEEIPLAMLSNKQQRQHDSTGSPTVPTATTTAAMKRPVIQCTSIKMSSRCNSASTASSSRPSFISKYSSSSGESGITSNCSSIHQNNKRISPLLPPPSPPSSDTTTIAAHDNSIDTVPSSSSRLQQEQGRKSSVTKRLFSSMHRLSRAVLISPASSNNVKSGDRKH